MKRGLFILLFILLIILVGCTYQVAEEVPETIEKKLPVAPINFTRCENPENEFEIKACNLIEDNPRLQQCKQRENLGQVFFCIAIITKDLETCKNIKKGLTHYLCKAYTTDNPSACDELEKEKLRNLCYMDLGMNLQDEELCNKIINEAAKTACLAVVNLDIEKCFENEGTKEVCITNVIEHSPQGKALCGSLDEEKHKECLAVLGEV